MMFLSSLPSRFVVVFFAFHHERTRKVEAMDRMESSHLNAYHPSADSSENMSR